MERSERTEKNSEIVKKEEIADKEMEIEAQKLEVLKKPGEINMEKIEKEEIMEIEENEKITEK